eukprot:TRINITY_DN1400_c0_g1_i1.p1 TRINITY_DN1400_c0_g1~~TRINITY_DN1400_c0_g1_i1.p1  ORF type:complete len:650 (+),score=177.55 TRINITY_DN1400_c0_g1_i1:16-1965(+)
MDLGLTLILAAVILLAIALLLRFFPKKKAAPVVVEPQKKVSYGEIYLCFGSQTGTASNFCKTLASEARNEGFEPIVFDLADFKAEDWLHASRLAIFCMATHGEGEPTDNAVRFFRWLNASDTPTDALKRLRFAVFGLGNRQYQYFNAMGRKTNQIFENLGGERVYKYGEGDDDVVIEDDFNEWKRELWTELKAKSVARASDEPASASAKPAGPKTAFSVEIVQKPEVDLNHGETRRRLLETADFDFLTKQWLGSDVVKVSKIEQKRDKPEFGSTLHVEFDLRGTQVTYGTAQNCLFFPANEEEAIRRLATHLNLRLEDVFEVSESSDGGAKRRKGKLPVPSPISVRSFLTNFVDLQGTLKKSTLTAIAALVEDPAVKARLTAMAGPTGKEQFEREILVPHKGLLDLILEFNIKPSLAQLIDISSRIPPRYYTIASSPLQHPTSMHIVVSLVSTPLPTGIWSGQISKNLVDLTSQMERSGKVFARVSTSKSSFVLPEDGRPLLMVGPGTGVAPFRAILQEKSARAKTGGAPLGDTWLFFGCHRPDSDFIYHDEIEAWQKDGTLTRLDVAYSRQDPSKRLYVQHLLREKADEVIEWIEGRGAVVLVCGLTYMGKDVKNLLGELLGARKGIDGETLIKQMEDEQRLICELWG